jgi:hypothetical protein
MVSQSLTANGCALPERATYLPVSGFSYAPLEPRQAGGCRVSELIVF